MTSDERANLLDSLRAGVPWAHRDLARRQATARALAEADATWAADLAAAEAEGEAERDRVASLTRIHVAEPASGIAQGPTLAPAPIDRGDFGSVAPQGFAASIAALQKASAELVSVLPVPAAVPRPITTDATTAGDRVRGEALDLAPGVFGMLLWVERKRKAAGLDPLDPQWLWHFDSFYASGKTVDVGRFGLRAAKSWSVCTALVAESLLMPRRLSVVGRCPIMSSDKSEAGDRFTTICEVLRACGLSEMTRGEPDSGSFKTSGGGSQANVIELFDFDGHPIEFRTQAASVKGAAGFTGIAGFGDELDLWGRAEGANPARQVVEVLVTRYTTQPDARLHLMSATYDRESYHAELIDGGDTPLRYVARLGERGAEKDMRDRTRLARATGSTDPMLLAPSDPRSVNVPSWVSNPVAPIEDCYKKADGDIRRMFSLYGAKPELAENGPSEQWRGLADRNAALVRAVNERTATPTIGTHPLAPPGDPRFAPPRRTGGGTTL